MTAPYIIAALIWIGAPALVWWAVRSSFDQRRRKWP